MEKWLMILIMKVLSFSTKYCKIEQKINICINVLSYENDLTYPVYVLDKKFECCIDLLVITDEIKSYYAYIKNFNRFMFNKTKNNNKKHFCRYCLQCFSSEKVLIEYKETSLEINGKQSIKLKRGSFKFKNYLKQ